MLDPVVPGASERRFRGLRLKLLVSFGAGGVVVEGEWPIRPSSLWQRLEVECLLCAGMGVEFSVFFGGGRGAVAFLGLWVGIIVSFLWLWMLELSACL